MIWSSTKTINWTSREFTCWNLFECINSNESSDWIIDLTIDLDEFLWAYDLKRKSTSGQSDRNSQRGKSRLSKKIYPSIGLFESLEQNGGVDKLISITHKRVMETWK